MSPKEMLSFVMSLLGIGLVLFVMVYGSRWIVRRYTAGGGMGGGGNMRILDRMTLGKEHAIVIAAIYGGVYLVGVTGSQITLLKDLSGEDPARFAPQTPEKPASFAAVFKALVNKQGRGGGA